MAKSVMSPRYGSKRLSNSPRTLRRANRGKRRVKVGIRAAIFLAVLIIVGGILGISGNQNDDRRGPEYFLGHGHPQ
jgi:hypothetical protein